jgi:protein-S-isoprenylcysteine O-methyltransferase Ste14
MFQRAKAYDYKNDADEVRLERPQLRLVPAAEKAPGRFSFRISFIRDPGSLLAMMVMGLIMYNQVIRPGWPPSLPNVFSGGLVGLAIVLFAVRREPKSKGNALDATLAIVGTFSLAFMPIAKFHSAWITWLQIGGSGLWLWSLLYLGRSFGLAPADRGLKTAGPYQFIRHPMYAGELINALGAAIAVAGVEGTFVFSIWWLFQILRIMKEEQVIEGYREYSQRVHWRIIPGIW